VFLKISLGIEFEQWKQKIEEDEMCSFVKLTGSKGQTQYCQYNRGGIYKPKGTGKRQTKTQGMAMVTLCKCSIHIIT